ncbi:MAG: hypothetical protein KDB07_08225, partial [Planctomycetes bacterium]|nr:hypothetical protein [Planctomycetota bacterium]
MRIWLALVSLLTLVAAASPSFASPEDYIWATTVTYAKHKPNADTGEMEAAKNLSNPTDFGPHWAFDPEKGLFASASGSILRIHSRVLAFNNLEATNWVDTGRTISTIALKEIRGRKLWIVGSTDGKLVMGYTLERLEFKLSYSIARYSSMITFDPDPKDPYCWISVRQELHALNLTSGKTQSLSVSELSHLQQNDLFVRRGSTWLYSSSGNQSYRF